MYKHSLNSPLVYRKASPHKQHKSIASSITYIMSWFNLFVSHFVDVFQKHIHMLSTNIKSPLLIVYQIKNISRLYCVYNILSFHTAELLNVVINWFRFWTQFIILNLYFEGENEGELVKKHSDNVVKAETGVQTVDGETDINWAGAYEITGVSFGLFFIDSKK